MFNRQETDSVTEDCIVIGGNIKLGYWHYGLLRWAAIYFIIYRMQKTSIPKLREMMGGPK
jgi:hypothetical protein